MNQTRMVKVPTKELKKKVGLPKATVWDAYDEAVMQELTSVEKKSPDKLLNVFKKYEPKLSNFAYWYILGVCWVRLRDRHNLDDMFGELFLSERIDRVNSIMKPYEKKELMRLATQSKVQLYWPAKPGANIRYFLSLEGVKDACQRIGINRYYEGFIDDNKAIIAYFERVNTKEVVIVDPSFLKSMDAPLFQPMLKSF